MGRSGDGKRNILWGWPNCFPGYYSGMIFKEFRHFALVFLLTKEENTASFPGILGRRFNNLAAGCAFGVILTSLVQYDLNTEVIGSI